MTPSTWNRISHAHIATNHARAIPSRILTKYSVDSWLTGHIICSYRVSVTMDSVDDLECDPSGSPCTTNQTLSFPTDEETVFQPPPLRNCSAVSRQNPTWTVENITYSAVLNITPPTQLISGTGVVVAQVSMPDIDYSMSCIWQDDGIGNTWNDCTDTFGNSADAPPTWFRFNQSTFEVELKQSWICDGTDHAHQ